MTSSPCHLTFPPRSSRCIRRVRQVETLPKSWGSSSYLERLWNTLCGMFEKGSDDFVIKSRQNKENNIAEAFRLQLIAIPLLNSFEFFWYWLPRDICFKPDMSMAGRFLGKTPQLSKSPTRAANSLAGWSTNRRKSNGSWASVNRKSSTDTGASVTMTAPGWFSGCPFCWWNSWEPIGDLEEWPATPQCICTCSIMLHLQGFLWTMDLANKASSQYWWGEFSTTFKHQSHILTHGQVLVAWEILVVWPVSFISISIKSMFICLGSLTNLLQKPSWSFQPTLKKNMLVCWHWYENSKNIWVAIT